MVNRIVGNSPSMVHPNESNPFLGYIQRERIKKEDFANKVITSLVSNDRLNPSAEKNVYFRLARPGTLKVKVYWGLHGEGHYVTSTEHDFSEPSNSHTLRADNYWDTIKIECIAISEDLINIMISS